MAIINLTPYIEPESHQAQKTKHGRYPSRHSALRLVPLFRSREAHSGDNEGLANGFNGFV